MAIERAADRMDELIDDLLTLARNGDEVGEVESIDLESIIARCWRNVETDRATVDIEGCGTVVADRSQLKQLLENLFRNAVEHTGPDVTITAGVLESGDGFFVEDNGPGIPPGDREQVFEAGYSMTDDGTGFGLAIVRLIAEGHGWEIALVESESGGARFEFSDVNIEQ